MNLCPKGQELVAKKPERSYGIQLEPAKKQADYMARQHYARRLNNHLQRCKRCSK